MTGTIAPQAMYDRKGFKVLRTESEERFSESKGGVDNKMEGYKGNPRFFMKPLKVMLGSYLDRSGFGKRKVGGRTIERTMI